MKFSFGEPHLWRQHALSLLSMGRYDHALAVLKEVIHLEPAKSINCLLAAKLCYEHLNMPSDGVEFSQEAKKRELQFPSGLLGKCHLYVGIGYYLQAQACLLKHEKCNFNTKALENFKRFAFVILIRI